MWTTTMVQKFQTYRCRISLKLHQKGNLKRRENEGRRLDIQVKGSQKKPHTKRSSLHTLIQLTSADNHPLPFFFPYSWQKYDMNVPKPNFPACMTPSPVTWVEVASAQLVSVPAPSTQVGVTYNSKSWQLQESSPSQAFLTRTTSWSTSHKTLSTLRWVC